MLTGNNGILAQAQKAKTETEDSQEDELRRLTVLEAATNLENTTYTDKNRQTAPIPAGFAVSQVEGENTIEDGLVIIDSEGNEFVWIPVTDEKKYIRNETYDTIEVSQSAQTDTGYLPEGIQPTIDDSTNNENAERSAVTSKGGFYISRYEAGKETSGDTNKLVSKSGATVWEGISQANCKTEAKKFINNDNVKSALCSGIQWDMTMAFVNGKEDGSAYGDKTYNVEQYKQNRHIGSTPSTSGQNPADRVCNIFDLEGNCYEYVAEKNSYYDKYYDTRMQIVSRGGFYSDTYPASCRNGYDGRGYGSHSFRFVLYVM